MNTPTLPLIFIFGFFMQSLVAMSPTLLSAVGTGESTIELNWADNSDNETGFRVERSATGGGAWTELGAVAADSVSFTDTGLFSATTYYYQALAENSAGSRYSTVASLLLDSSPSNIALNRPVVASSIGFDDRYEPELAVDGIDTDDASRWLSGTTQPHWLEVDVDGSYALSRMRFRTGHSSNSFPINDAELQYWSGSGWEVLHSISGNYDNEVDVSFSPVSAGSRLRFYVSALNTTLDPVTLDPIAPGDSNLRLYELEIYGELDVLNPVSRSPASGDFLYDPSSDLTLTYGAPILAHDLSTITIIDIAQGLPLNGVMASVSGNTLRISHGGLTRESSYRLLIPDDSVALASDTAVKNKSLEYVFTVATAEPLIVTGTSELPNINGDLEYTFDRDVSAVDLSGIQVRDASSGSLLAGVSVSLNGRTLIISHGGLVARQVYLVEIPAGSLTGDINNEPNLALNRSVFAGMTRAFFGEFDSGYDGFQTARQLLGLTDSDYWRLAAETSLAKDDVGPGGDLGYLWCRHDKPSDNSNVFDFFVSPSADLLAAQTYKLSLRANNQRDIEVGLITSAALQSASEVADVIAAMTPVFTIGSSQWNKSVLEEFSPPSDGNWHLVFHTVPNSWVQLALDNIALDQKVAPVVQFAYPAEGSVYLESDPLVVQVAAHGISGEVSSVELFAGNQRLGEMVKKGDFYTYDWSTRYPGVYELRAVVTDTLNLTGETSRNVVIQFNDGTLPKYVGWNFDDDSAQGFSLTSIDGSGVNAQWGRIVVNTHGDNAPTLSSPKVSFLAGETYTLTLQARRASSNWHFMATTEPGYPASPDWSLPITTGSGTEEWTQHTISFTVPVDGEYYLTLFAEQSGYLRPDFDDIRLIGNFNSVPLVSFTWPDGDLTTLESATVRLDAVATDSDGTIASVEFRNADTGELLAPDAVVNSAPWTYDWVPMTPGIYNVIARAYDNSAGSGDSAARVVTVEPNNYSISTWVGGVDTVETFTGAGYLSDGTLVMSGIINPALFTGVTPLYLNGATAGDKGVVVRLSEDGQTLHSVTVLGARALDMDIGGSDRIHVAAGISGALVLNAAADEVLWSQSYGDDYTIRIDAAADGTFALVNTTKANYLDEGTSSSTNYIYNSGFVELGSGGGSGQYSCDVAVDTVNQTIVFVGFKNVADMEDGTLEVVNPVDVPIMYGRAYDGSLKWRAYDWGKQSEGDRWLNLPANNMADSRGSRVTVGPNGKIYAAFEFDGGNTPFRYDPLSVTTPVDVVGGDSYHTMAFTSTVPKTFVGIYDGQTGCYQTGQWFTLRKDNGADNTSRIKNGNIAVDDALRIHIVGSSAAGLPLTHDPLPEIDYPGGAFHLVYSPDFSSREYVTRLAKDGNYAGIAFSPNGKTVTAGQAFSDFHFSSNQWQSERIAGEDAHFAVGDLSAYYKFQTGEHPRLIFGQNNVAELRGRLSTEPYLSIYNKIVASLSDPAAMEGDSLGEAMRLSVAQAFLYVLTGDEAHAASSRTQVELVLNDPNNPWASSSLKGLTSYSMGTSVALAYDWCANSETWDPGFNFVVSRALLEMGEMIIENGGSEQNQSAASNWQGGRGASGGLSLIATDHKYSHDLLDSAYTRVENYLNSNLGSNSATRGWNPEGLGYTYYPLGNFVGPFGAAMLNFDPSRDLREHIGLQRAYWTIFEGASTALDIYGFGGVKADWSDDNGHIRGEGTYGQAFFYLPDSLKASAKWAYDRLQGEQSPNGPIWDYYRNGAIWSYIYYPGELPATDPATNWDWHIGADDSGGLGVFTFRDGYAYDAGDFIAQFKARLREVGGHNGPDGLGIRIIGHGVPWIVGGGRNDPGKKMGQATLYPAFPNTGSTANLNTGTVVGTPLIQPDGGGHAIGSMGLSNVGTISHKRWFASSYDSSQTGADAAYLIADTSTNGTHWMLPTYVRNTVSISGNTFTITGENGATLQGTVLLPANATLTTGTMDRGSAYTLLNGGTIDTEDSATNPRITENKYVSVEGAGGDFLIVLTVQDSGMHPSVSRLSGSVADAVVSVGSLEWTIQSQNILYNGSAYTAADATVTFDAGVSGTLSGAPTVQTVAYGQAAIAPTVTPDTDYFFTGWDRDFSQVVGSMTVTALYSGNATAPSIITAPQSQFFEEGSTVSLSVLADGFPSPIYQWKKHGQNLSDGGNISGTQTNQLTISNAAQVDAGDYTVEISNIEGTKTSSTAVLTFSLTEPTILEQPTGGNFMVAASTTLSVAATGSPTLFYLWKKDGVDLVDGGALSGTQSTALTIDPLAEEDSGTYTVSVSNGAGSVVSDAAEIVVNEAHDLVVLIDFGNVTDSLDNWNNVTISGASGLVDFGTGNASSLGVSFSGGVSDSVSTGQWGIRTVAPTWTSGSSDDALSDRFWVTKGATGTMTISGLTPGAAYEIEIASSYGGGGTSGDEAGAYELTDAGGLVEGFNVHTGSSLGTTVIWTPRGPGEGGVEGWLGWYGAVAKQDGTLSFALSADFIGGNPRVALNAMRVASVASSPQPTDINAWRQTHFGTTEASGDAADLNDPDGDGLVNFLEYAFGGAPLTSDSEAMMPEIMTTGDYLEFRFNRARSELTYSVEVSDDLAEWTTIETNPGSVGQEVTVQDNVPIGSVPSRFIRLEILDP